MELNILIVIAIIVLAIIAMLYIPRFMINRAIRSVIRIFRQNNAVTVRDAKTAEELDLNPKPFLQRAFRTRDYKPYALQILMNTNIIQATEDGRLYLAEDQLAASKWADIKH